MITCLTLHQDLWLDALRTPRVRHEQRHEPVRPTRHGRAHTMMYSGSRRTAASLRKRSIISTMFFMSSKTSMALLFTWSHSKGLQDRWNESTDVQEDQSLAHDSWNESSDLRNRDRSPTTRRSPSHHSWNVSIELSWTPQRTSTEDSAA